MPRPFVLALLFLAGAAVPAFAQAPQFQLKPGESARAFELRAAGAPDSDDTHILPAKWNGRPYVFVDFPVTRNIPPATEDDRDLVALAQMPDGSLKRVFVTTAEEEGGQGSIAAIGFGHPGLGQGTEDLIVLISWPVQHADVDGTLYEVRFFADPGATAPANFSLLKTLGQHFGHNSCDCGRTDEKPEHFPFKTMAAIKAELKKLSH